jgi:hypothetical protein
MARLDKIHDKVKTALIKDGWTITHDPYSIEYEDLTLFADLGAEKMFSAERGEIKIVVEVKSFSHLSKVQDFKLALGQYQLYNVYLKAIAPEGKLYLAVGEDIYEEFLLREAIKFAVEQLKISLVVVNLESEEVSQWIR